MSYYPLYYQIDSGLNLAKAPVIMTSASGSVASFPDGAADLPVQSLKVAINPVQDLHGYASPWPAGGGFVASGRPKYPRAAILPYGSGCAGTRGRRLWSSFHPVLPRLRQSETSRIPAQPPLVACGED